MMADALANATDTKACVVGPGAADAPRRAVELEIAGREQTGDMAGLGAAQQRLDAGDQLGQRERLDDIVVGAGGEAAHALGLLAAGGQHDDRHALGVAAGAQTPAELDAGEAGQHPVEQDEIGRMVAQMQFSVVAARHAVDLEALGLEIVAQQQGERLLVLDDQDACRHCVSLSLNRPPVQPLAAGRSTRMLVVSSFGRFSSMDWPVTR